MTAERPPEFRGKWYFVVALASLGLLAWVPFLHAAQRLRRPRLRLVAAGLAAGAVLGVVLTALAPTDRTGKPVGLVANLGSIALLAVMVVASLMIIGLRREVYETAPSDGSAGETPTAEPAERD